MSLTELSSIHPTYLYSVVTCDEDQPLKLKPCQENPLLHFHILREPQTGCEIQALHAGITEKKLWIVKQIKVLYLRSIIIHRRIQYSIHQVNIKIQPNLR
jgi:hypothetical protein